MSSPETEATPENKGKTKINYNSRSEDRRDDRISRDEYRTSIVNGLKGKLYIPAEIIPQDKVWMWFSINPNSTVDYELEGRRKRWVPVKRSAHKYFSTRSEKTKDHDSDNVIMHGNLLMELDKYLYKYMEEEYNELAHQKAASAGRKPQYSPRRPGLFERTEGKVEYSHERRKFAEDDY